MGGVQSGATNPLTGKNTGIISGFQENPFYPLNWGPEFQGWLTKNYLQSGPQNVENFNFWRDNLDYKGFKKFMEFQDWWNYCMRSGNDSGNIKMYIGGRGGMGGHGGRGNRKGDKRGRNKYYHWDGMGRRYYHDKNGRIVYQTNYDNDWYPYYYDEGYYNYWRNNPNVNDFYLWLLYQNWLANGGNLV